ncbi:MAG: hypothetical protein KHY88_04240 [Erysipelotrichaceae bacterium]|nr:hypothetical protein [Erysipelotrichaceae bacterium]
MYKITKANSTHYQYFKQEILTNGAGYIVSNASSIIGLFSFTFDYHEAKLSFNYVYDINAVSMLIEQFFKDYPNIDSIYYTGHQRLEKIGFKQNVLRREKHG